MAKKKENPKDLSESPDMSSKAPVSDKREVNTISIWSILESEEFDKAFKQEIQEFKNSRLNAEIEVSKSHPGAVLKRHPLSTLILEDFNSDPDGMVVEYLRIMAKKSNLSASKRSAIKAFISPIVQEIAKKWTNQMFEEKNKQEEKPKAKRKRKSTTKKQADND